MSPGTSCPGRPRQAGKLKNEVAEQMDQQCLPFSLPFTPHTLEWANHREACVCVRLGGAWAGWRRLQRPVSPRHAHSTAHTPNLRLKGLPLCGRGGEAGEAAEQWGPHNSGGWGGQLHHKEEGEEAAFFYFLQPPRSIRGAKHLAREQRATLSCLCPRVGEKRVERGRETGVWR